VSSTTQGGDKPPPLLWYDRGEPLRGLVGATLQPAFSWGLWEGLYGRPPSLSGTYTRLVINPTGYAGDHKGLCWRMKGRVQLSVRTPGVWEIRQETPFLPDEPGKADQKIDFSWGHSALHSFYHSPTESKGPPNPSQPPSPLRIPSPPAALPGLG